MEKINVSFSQSVHHINAIFEKKKKIVSGHSFYVNRYQSSKLKSIFLFKEYTWRRKTAEGASRVCEICGHLAYKLFTQVVESSFDGKRNRRQFNDSVQV